MSAVDIYDGMALVGLILLGLGIAVFSWPVAAIVVGLILLVVGLWPRRPLPRSE